MPEHKTITLHGIEVPATEKGRKPRFDHNQRQKPGANGRPAYLARVRYTKKLGRYIYSQMISGKTIRRLCETDAEMPTVQTVMKWATNPEHHFYDLYRAARQIQAELLVDDIIDIADSATAESASSAKVRIDARRWLASKELEKYSDKATNGGTGEVHVTLATDGNGLKEVKPKKK